MKKKSESLIKKFFAQREASIFLVIFIICVGLNFSTPNFFTKTNLITLVVGLSFDAIVAVGMTVLLVSGGFDLSVGATLAVSGATAGFAIMEYDAPPLIAIILGLAVGALIGVVNGLLVAKVKVNPLIATLGMMQAIRGVVLLLTSGYGIPNLPPEFYVIGQGKFLGFQYPVWVMVVLVIVGEILLRRSRYFRQSYFVGGNEKSARLSGINVDSVKIVNYLIAGLMASAAGILLTARFGTASVSAGVGTELRVISAVILGGASLAGGEGSILGSLLGVLLMALISNGLNLLGINVYWQTIVIGTVLVIAVAADSLGQRRKN